MSFQTVSNKSNTHYIDKIGGKKTMIQIISQLYDKIGKDDLLKTRF